MHSYIIVDKLSPFLVKWNIHGHTVGIRWYGLCYVFSFYLTYLYFSGAARRGKVRGLDMAVVDTLTFSTAFGIVFGGRLGFVVQHLHEWARDPLFPFRLTEGGMTFVGGLLGVLIAVAWVGKKYGMGFLVLTDIATFPAALGLALGRIANFANGELVGKPTDGKWGVIFPRVDYLPRYPSQLYESVSHFIMYAILICTNKYASNWSSRPGRLSFLFLTMYGIERFLTDFYRQDDTYIGPFSTGQWTCVLVAIAGIVGLVLLRTRHTANQPQKI